MRDLIARHFGVAPQSVHAIIAGEHGDSEFPLWSTATVGGVPVQDFSMPGGTKLDSASEDRIAREVVTAAKRIIRGKGATNYAVGLAATRVIEAVVRDENGVLPVTSLLDGHFGLSDVCLSLPSVVNRSGVTAVLDVPMSDREQELLQFSARAVRAVAESRRRRVAAVTPSTRQRAVGSLNPGPVTADRLRRAAADLTLAAGQRSENPDAVPGQVLHEGGRRVPRTAILVILGNGAVANVHLKGSKGFASGWIVIASGYGIGVMVPVMMFHQLSSQINPAVTIALAAWGHQSWSVVPAFVTAQLLGAMVCQLAIVVTHKPYYDQTKKLTTCSARSPRSNRRGVGPT